MGRTGFQKFYAMLGLMFLVLSANAQDPLVFEIYSPIVADDSAENLFVYPDAFSLDSIIHPGTPDTADWSFEGDGTYSINGTPPLTAPYSPQYPGPYGIHFFDYDPASIDADRRTLTFRNIILSPIGGPNVTPAQGGILADHTKVITLHQHDGASDRVRSFLVYTSNGGIDELSGSPRLMPIISPTNPAQMTGWTPYSVLGQPIFTTGSQGLCISVSAGGEANLQGNFGAWISPYQILSLTKNHVYRIRINVAANPAVDPTTTPLWDFSIDNARADPQTQGLLPGSQNKYGMSLINWDNANSSANSAGPASPNGRHTFDIWWTPMAVHAEDWNNPATGEFTAFNDPFNDARFHFRILDVNGAIDAHNDAGTLCLKSLQIDRIQINDLDVTETMYFQAAPAAEMTDYDRSDPPSDPNANMSLEVIFDDSTILENLEEGGIVLKPRTLGIGSYAPSGSPTVSGSWYVELMTLEPGDTMLRFHQPSTIVDNYPIQWNSNQLLKITVGAEAPDAQGQINPPDVLRLIMDSATNELGCENVFSAGPNLLGMPKFGTEITYTSFFYTHNRTATPTVEYQGLRPRFGLMCVPQILSAGLNVNNGGIKINFMKVERIDTDGL